MRAHVAGSVVLDCTRLRHAAKPGGVGILVGGDDLLLGALRWSAEPPAAPGTAARAAGRRGSFARWEVSEAFAERDLAAQLDAEHDWTTLDAEPVGLADLARVNPVRDGADTVLARVVVHADRAVTSRSSSASATGRSCI